MEKNGIVGCIFGLIFLFSVLFLFENQTFAAEPEKVRVLIGMKGPAQVSAQNVVVMAEEMNKIEVLLKSKGGKVSHNFHPFIDVISVTIPEAALYGISKNPNILYIEEDAIATTQGRHSLHGNSLLPASLKGLSSSGIFSLTYCVAGRLFIAIRRPACSD